MTPDEQARLRVVELWQGRHEEKCEGRHQAIGLRLETIESLLRAAVDSQNKNWIRTGHTLFLALVFLVGFSHHPKVLFDLLDLLP